VRRGVEIPVWALKVVVLALLVVWNQLGYLSLIKLEKITHTQAPSGSRAAAGPRAVPWRSSRHGWVGDAWPDVLASGPATIRLPGGALGQGSNLERGADTPIARAVGAVSLHGAV
jgi:hypothetical protein